MPTEISNNSTHNKPCRAPAPGDYTHHHDYVADIVHRQLLSNVDSRRDHQRRIINRSHHLC